MNRRARFGNSVENQVEGSETTTHVRWQWNPLMHGIRARCDGLVRIANSNQFSMHCEQLARRVCSSMAKIIFLQSFMLDSYISIASNRMPFSAVHTIAIKVEIWDGNEKWAKTNGVDVCVCVFSFLPSEMTSDLNLLSVIYGLYWILFCVPMFRSRLQPRWWWGNPWCVYDFYDEPFPVCCR